LPYFIEQASEIEPDDFERVALRLGLNLRVSWLDGGAASARLRVRACGPFVLLALSAEKSLGLIWRQRPDIVAVSVCPGESRMVFEDTRRAPSTVVVSSEGATGSGVARLLPSNSKRAEDESYWIFLRNAEAEKWGVPFDFTGRGASQFPIETALSLSFATWADQFIGSPLDDRMGDEVKLRSWMSALTQPLRSGEREFSQTTHYFDVIGAAALRVRDLEQPTSVAELAEKLGISTRTLQRAFRGGLGVSTKRYLKSQQLRLAAEMLRTGRYSVSFVAQAVGFHHHSRFSKEYAEFFRCLPSVTEVDSFQAEFPSDFEFFGGAEPGSKVIRTGSRLAREHLADVGGENLARFAR
jgi:AraC-like DNA-binding protein